MATYKAPLRDMRFVLYELHNGSALPEFPGLEDMTPELLDYFFNKRTQVFANLSDDQKRRFHEIYDLTAYQAVLPTLPPGGERDAVHTLRHQRFSVICPGELVLDDTSPQGRYRIQVIECSMNGFRARADRPLPLEAAGLAHIDLGRADRSTLQVRILRKAHSNAKTYVVKVEEPDLAWRKFVNALRKASIHSDLDDATRFLQ